VSTDGDKRLQDLEPLLKMVPSIVVLRWVLGKKKFEFLVEDHGAVDKEDFQPDSKEFAEIERLEKKWVEEGIYDVFIRFSKRHDHAA